MQPIRKVMSATHFKLVDDDGKEKYTPCSPGDPAAKEMSWSEIESDELKEPPLRLADFLKSLESVRPTVTGEDIRKHDQWTLESGAWCLTHPRALFSHCACRQRRSMSLSQVYIMECCCMNTWFTDSHLNTVRHPFLSRPP